MSSDLLEPPPRQRRRFATMPRLSKDPEVRSVQVGVLATIFIHLLLFLLAPMMLKNEFTGAMRPVPRSNPEPFSVELAPDAFAKKEDPLAKFVETNPDAPENIPDKTTNFGAQNQQVAQEKPSENKPENDRPAIEGEKDVQSTQIVDGQLRQPQLPHEAAPPAEPTPPTEQMEAPKKEQNPLSGFEKTTGENPDGIGSNVAQSTPNPQDVPEKVEGVKDAPDVQGSTNHMVIDPKKPMPRQVITKNVRPAIFQENKIGTANIGPVAYDARWSNYGQYLQKLIEAVQLRWDDLISSSKHYPQRGSTVSVAFTLSSSGKVDAIIKVDGTADKLATSWCVSAISPNEGFSYGPWTDDMVAVLGTSQDLTFTFLYR